MVVAGISAARANPSHWVRGNVSGLVSLSPIFTVLLKKPDWNLRCASWARKSYLRGMPKWFSVVHNKVMSCNLANPIGGPWVKQSFFCLRMGLRKSKHFTTWCVIKAWGMHLEFIQCIKPIKWTPFLSNSEEVAFLIFNWFLANSIIAICMP